MISSRINEQCARSREGKGLGEMHQQNTESVKKTQSPSFRFPSLVPVWAQIENSVPASQRVCHPTAAVEKEGSEVVLPKDVGEEHRKAIEGFQQYYTKERLLHGNFESNWKGPVHSYLENCLHWDIHNTDKVVFLDTRCHTTQTLASTMTALFSQQKRVICRLSGRNFMNCSRPGIHLLPSRPRFPDVLNQWGWRIFARKKTAIMPR